MCMMSGAQARCKPNAEALELGQKIRVCNWVIFACVIGWMVSADWSPVTFTIFAFIFGWCSIREGPHVYKIDKVRCVCILSGYCFVTTGVHLIYLCVNSGAYNIEAGSANQKVSVVCSAVAVAFFAANCYFGKTLYDILRLNYMPPDPEYAQDPGMFGGFGGPRQRTQANAQGRQPAQGFNQQQAPPQGYGQQSAPQPSAPPQNSGNSGFVPFGGNGNRLG